MGCYTEAQVAQSVTDGACTESISSFTRGLQAVAVQKALKEGFKLECRQTHYQAEFQTHRKKMSEGGADFMDNLQSLVEKTYPSLQHEAHKLLVVNTCLQQLTQQQVAYDVKQKRLKTLDKAVATLLEMESYPSSPYQLEQFPRSNLKARPLLLQRYIW